MLTVENTASPDFTSVQHRGSKRTELQRHALSIAGREVIQVRIDFDPCFRSPEHMHPGDEIVYVLEGTLEYRVQGRPPVTLRPGGVLFIPALAIHTVTNVGTGTGAELATYIVDRHLPLVAPVRQS